MRIIEGVRSEMIWVMRLRTMLIAAIGLFISLWTADTHMSTLYAMNVSNGQIVCCTVIWTILIAISEYRFVHYVKKSELQPWLKENMIIRMMIIMCVLATAAEMLRICTSDLYLEETVNMSIYHLLIIFMFLISLIDTRIERHKNRLIRYLCMPAVELLTALGILGIPFGISSTYHILSDITLRNMFILQMLIPLYIISLAKEAFPDDHMISACIKGGMNRMIDWLTISDE